LSVTLVMRTAEERHALTEAITAGGFTSDSSFLKCAVWKLIRHLDVPLSVDAFALPYTPRVVAEELAQDAADMPLLEEA
jgi:hypothetical protein